MKELPACMNYVWKYFIDLNNRRSNNGFGALPLQYSEILAYFTLHKIEYEPTEISLIEVLDSIAMKCFYEESQRKQNKKQQ